MDIDSILAEIEEDSFWRQNEVRFFQNTLLSISAEVDKNRFRRALVVMLYAHFEGFTKFAFRVYVDALNNNSIKCKDALPCLVAATVSDALDGLNNPSKKSNLFRHTAPDDSKLHSLSRQIEFMERLDEVGETFVSIPYDVVSTESNLKPVVLRKILFRLGFNVDSLYGIEGNMNRLLKSRNDIVHGEKKEGFDDVEYEQIRDMVFDIMEKIRVFISKALLERKYLRAAS